MPVGMITSCLENNGVGGKCEVNDIRVATFYPGADIKTAFVAGLSTTKISDLASIAFYHTLRPAPVVRQQASWC